MSIEITVPQLGESIVEATVGQWRKREGETVVAGEPLVELETDKVNIEVPSPGDGVLTSILKHEGDTVAVGEVLAQISTEAQPARQPARSAAASSTSNGTATVLGAIRANRRADRRRPRDARGATPGHRAPRGSPGGQRDGRWWQDHAG